MVYLSGISSTKAYRNLLKKHIKFSELSPVFRLVSSETKLFYYYLQVEVVGLLKSMKFTSHKGQRRGPAIRKEFNTFLSPETVLFNSLNFVTTKLSKF